eukprot:gb/GECH01012374.1/.p1 GENE.gb/GECH01012374.1/~~gb/GECH01012374.1/.p1  ORF type:complete len:170 (+),score=17.22 gb/GECH01012374.1/:1-510(+)
MNVSFVTPTSDRVFVEDQLAAHNYYTHAILPVTNHLPIYYLRFKIEGHPAKYFEISPASYSTWNTSNNATIYIKYEDYLTVTFSIEGACFLTLDVSENNNHLARLCLRTISGNNGYQAFNSRYCSQLQTSEMVPSLSSNVQIPETAPDPSSFTSEQPTLQDTEDDNLYL